MISMEVQIKAVIFLPDTQIETRSGSVVRIATGFGLDGPAIESRWG